MMILRIFCYLLITSLLGCTVSVVPTPIDDKPAIEFESDLFGQRPDIITAADIYRLTDEQQQAFFEYFDDPLSQSIPAHKRVFDYLETITNNYNYQGATNTARIALEESSGNCLTLAILTTALAKLAGIDIGYQLTNSTPVYELQGTVIYKGVHVRSILYDPMWQPKEGVFTIIRPGLRIDYFPGGRERFIRNLTDSEYIAMYYRNLAADSLAREDYNAAYWLLLESMEHAPNNANGLNTMAVVYRRVGDEAKAEQIYQYGLEYLTDRVSLLRNYRILLNKQARFDEAENISKNLKLLDDPNPFDWFLAGQDAYNKGDFNDAIYFYRKAVKIAPYLHEAYLGMAITYFQISNFNNAERELRRAMEYAYRKSTRSLYQAKLMSLRQETPSGQLGGYQ